LKIKSGSKIRILPAVAMLLNP